MVVDGHGCRAAQRLDRVDDVDRVAETKVALRRRHLGGAGVVAVVDVQHDVAGSRQPVLLTAHALAVHVDRRVDVAVRQHDRRERPLALRHVELGGDAEVTGAVADGVRRVRRGACQHLPEAQVAPVVRLVEQGRHRDRVDATGRLLGSRGGGCLARASRGARGAGCRRRRGLAGATLRLARACGDGQQEGHPGQRAEPVHVSIMRAPRNSRTGPRQPSCARRKVMARCMNSGQDRSKR